MKDIIMDIIEGVTCLLIGHKMKPSKVLKQDLQCTRCGHVKVNGNKKCDCDTPMEETQLFCKCTMCGGRR